MHPFHRPLPTHEESGGRYWNLSLLPEERRRKEPNILPNLEYRENSSLEENWLQCLFCEFSIQLFVFLNWWFFDRWIPESPHLSGGVSLSGWEGRLSIGTNQLLKYERRSNKNLSPLWVRFFVTKNFWAKRINIKNPSRANIITNSHIFSWTLKSTRESWDISLSEPPPSEKILKFAEAPRKKVSLPLPMNLPTSSSCVVCPLSSLFSPILTTTLMITGERFKVWWEVLEPQPPSWSKKKKRTESFAKFGISVKFVVGRELASRICMYIIIFNQSKCSRWRQTNVL